MPIRIMLNFNTFYFLVIYIFVTFAFHLLSSFNGILFDFTFTLFYFMNIQQVILLFCLCLNVFLSVKDFCGRASPVASIKTISY